MKTFFLVLIAASTSHASIVPGGAPPAASARLQRTVESVQGQVTLRRRGGKAAALKPGPVSLKAGDVLKSDKDGRVVLYYPDGSRVEVGPSSTVMVKEDRELLVELLLKGGVLKAKVSRRGWRPFRIALPSAVTTARGASFTALTGADGVSTIQVERGQLAVRAYSSSASRLPEAFLYAGESVTADDEGLGKIITIAPPLAFWATSGAGGLPSK